MRPGGALMLLIALGIVIACGLFTPARWSPYLSGGLVGVIAALCLVVSGETLGASTSFVRLAGLLSRLFAPRAVEGNELYRSTGVRVDWQMMLVIGLGLGALLSALLGGGFRPHWVPDMWRATFGGDPALRLPIAFLGGLLVIFGARWAGGCTSGHGISGAAQMTVAGWLSAICFFSAGIATAIALYGPETMVR